MDKHLSIIDEVSIQSAEKNPSKLLNGGLNKLMNKNLCELLEHTDTIKPRNEDLSKSANQGYIKLINDNLNKLYLGDSEEKMEKLSHDQHNQDNLIMDCTATNHSSLIEKDNLVSNEFKIKLLTTTLNFIKDNDQYVLEYPEIPLAETEFIESLITHNYNSKLCSKLRPLYASIKEAIIIFKLKYEFNLQMIKNEKSVQLIFKKIAKNHFKTSKKQNTNKEPLHSRCVKIKTTRKETKLIDELPIHFVLDSLKKISDFLKDELSVSIVFKNMNTKEWTFLKNVKSLLKNRFDLLNDLPAPVNELLEQIDTYKEHDFTLTLNVIILNKSKKERNVTLMKSPKFSNRHFCSDNLCTDRNVAYPSRDQNEESSPDNSSPRNKLLSALSSTANDEELISCSSADRPTLNSSIDSLTVSVSSDKSRQLSLERRPISAPKSNIKFQSGDSFDSQHVETAVGEMKPEQTQNRGRIRERMLGSRKTKLLEAMSVPIESEKGLSIMLRMGWKGGALGTRGEGITEPIIPDLDIVSGAGLGHNKSLRYRYEMFKKNLGTNSAESLQSTASDSDGKPKKKMKKVVANRLKILEEILDLIVSSEAKIIYFDKQLQKKEKKFLKHAIHSFNAKSNITLHDKLEQQMVQKILDAMTCNRGVTLDAKVSANIMEIELSKTTNNVNVLVPVNMQTNRCNKDLNENYPEAPTLNVEYGTDTKVLSLSEFMSSMNPMETYGVYAKKSFRTFAFKLMVFEEILAFLQSQDLERKFGIDGGSVFKRDLSLFKKYIDNVNARCKEKFVPAIEQSITERILDKLGTCRLSYDYDKSQKIIKIKKIFDKNMSNNSSTTCTPQQTNKAYSIDDFPMCMKTDQEDILQTEVNTEMDSNVHESVTIQRTEHVLTLTESKNDNSDENGIKVPFEEMSSNENINNIDMINDMYVTLDSNEDWPEESSTLRDIKDLEKSDEISSNKNINDIDMINEISNDMYVTLDGHKDWPEESFSLLRDIKDLEKSILEENIYKEKEPCSASKRLSADFEYTETKNTKRIKTNSFKSYKNICITCKDPTEEMNLKAIQKLLSDAIDERDGYLPLLQCHGANNNQLLYSCFDENTYHWIQKILCDKFVIKDIGINIKDKYRLQMKLRSFVNVDDTHKLLDKVKLYNPDLDISTWTVIGKVMSNDFVLIEIEVDGTSFDYINHSDFSLFAGVDKVQFNVI